MPSPDKLVDTTLDPFENKFLQLKAGNMHFVDEGKGDLILFVHGTPTWSFLYRDFIKNLSKDHRCIAIDHLGFGLSDKPDIQYTMADHIRYVEHFINELDLQNITLVMHGSGSIIGSHLAMQQPTRYKGLAYIESHLRPNDDLSKISLPLQQFVSELDLDGGLEQQILENNTIVKKWLLSGMMTELTEAEIEQYLLPFTDKNARRPLVQHIKDMPKGQSDSDVLSIIRQYSKQLCQSDVPKLLMYALPGFATSIEVVVWAKNHLSNLTVEEIGEALHFPQESETESFNRILERWLVGINTP